MPNWEISIIELKKNGETKYKVTRRMPEMHAAETKIFNTKNEALRQMEEWLD